MSAISDFVMEQPLFCHHDHHANYRIFDEGREKYDFRSLLGYAVADLVTAAGVGSGLDPANEEGVRAWWPSIRATGYGRAVDLGCKALFGLSYSPENFSRITESLRSAIAGKSAAEVYRYFVHERAGNRWTLHDGHFNIENPHVFASDGTAAADLYPDSYRFAFRIDALFSMVDAGPIAALERFTGRAIYTLDQLVAALNAAVDRFAATGKLAAFKVGMAYQRELIVGDPTHHEAETAFCRIRNRSSAWDGVRQEPGAVDARTARPLGDYMLHRFIQRAADDGIPMQFHTGYLAGNWGALDRTEVSFLISLLAKYRTVRFDLFHGSWPWGSELGTLAKNYPNVWPDLCWAWTMDPAASERALSEWIDAVPFNKIFAYGADTGLPWCNTGYSLQAKLGIARVLEGKIAAGYVSESTAREIAEQIMLRNGEAFYGLG